jgi:hypothetical protein
MRASYDWDAAIARTDRAVVADDDGIVGVVECEHDPLPTGQPWLHRLYVIPSAWGTGVATALHDNALAAVDCTSSQKRRRPPVGIRDQRSLLRHVIDEVRHPVALDDRGVGEDHRRWLEVGEERDAVAE